MHLSPFTSPVRDHLTAAAALGDDRTREIAAALNATVESAVRVAVLDALAAAAADLSDALVAETDGRVSAVGLQLAGDEVQFTVTGAAFEPTPEAPPVDDGDTTARISLRLGEVLKSEIERAAKKTEISVNSWLVRAATTALSTPEKDRRTKNSQHRMTGWVTG